jgi:acyl transferase domain-containing protein
MADHSRADRHERSMEPVTIATVSSCTLAPKQVWDLVDGAGDTVFVFPGAGWHWTRVAVELLSDAPPFVDEMRRCDAAFTEFLDWSPLEFLRGDIGASGTDRVDVMQPVLFAVMVSVAALARSQGIVPDAVLGHSQGEIAAAYVAGALSLREAAKIVTSLSKAISTISGAGGMVSIPLPIHHVCALIEPWGESLSVAAQNGPASTVVTGYAAALDELVAGCERDRVPAVRIPVAYAAHSTQVEAMRETLRETLSDLQPRTGDIPFISGVTGAGLDTSILDGDYWFANLRQPVLFEQAVRWSYEHGYRTFLEASPLPVLTSGIRESVDEYGAHHPVVTAAAPLGGDT